jgi:hypothetical protein
LGEEVVMEDWVNLPLSGQVKFIGMSMMFFDDLEWSIVFRVQFLGGSRCVDVFSRESDLGPVGEFGDLLLTVLFLHHLAGLFQGAFCLLLDLFESLHKALDFWALRGFLEDLAFPWVLSCL